MTVMTSGETTCVTASELLLGRFLLVVAFPLVNGHFTVHYMCCTRMTFRLGVRDSLITTEGHPRAGGLPAGPRLPAEPHR
jgi:hypothetical protein